jgi:hypothetical protein
MGQSWQAAVLISCGDFAAKNSRVKLASAKILVKFVA